MLDWSFTLILTIKHGESIGIHQNTPWVSNRIYKKKIGNFLQCLIWNLGQKDQNVWDLPPGDALRCGYQWWDKGAVSTKLEQKMCGDSFFKKNQESFTLVSNLITANFLLWLVTKYQRITDRDQTLAWPSRHYSGIHVNWLCKAVIKSIMRNKHLLVVEY
jgi:hypothetical protein